MRSAMLRTCNDPRAVAYQVTREAWLAAGGGSNFNRELHYIGPSIA